MDKKILLGGAAALLLVGNMYATPASAAIDLSVSGSAKVTATMNDACGDDTGNTTLNAAVGNLSALNTAIGVTMTETDGTTTAIDGPDFSCAADADHPLWGYEKKIKFSAGGTLANGLNVSFSDELQFNQASDSSFDLTFDGAFGSLTIANGADSGVKAAAVNAESDITVAGPDLGGHSWGTSGTAGMGFLYTTPAVGGADLFFSYSPNTGSDGLDNAAYLDTFGLGASFATDMLTLSVGFESADNKTNNCSVALAAAGDLDAIVDVNSTTLDTVIDKLAGTEYCGDMSNTAIGMTMNAGDIAINAGWTKLETDEADKTTWNVGADTTVGEYSLGVNYRNSKKEFGRGSLEDTQTVIGASLGTSLGDGVDLSLDFSTSSYDSFSSVAAHDTTNYNVEAAVSVAF